GRATARAFAELGSSIGLVARGRDGLEAARRDVEARGGRGLVLPVDVSDAAAVESAAATVEEGAELIDAKAEPEVRDAGLIAAAQKVEHYEIAGYGCLSTWADQLSLGEVKRLLGETLEEEKQADHLLNQIAESQINAQSASR
ncbi:MAG: DUF892 family protein, partial [Planctomycetaceae bacterium]|nr:DUF892 family protein [Planctomycetaceae bacterium]